MKLISNEYSNWMNTDNDSEDQTESVTKLYQRATSLRNSNAALHNLFLDQNNLCTSQDDVTGFKDSFFYTIDNLF